MEINEETNTEKDYDNENSGLNKMEVIQFYSYPKKKYPIKRYKKILIVLSFLFLSVLIILIAFNYLNNTKNTDNDYQIVKYKAKKVEKQIKETPKKVIAKKEEPKKETAPKIIPKKPGIAFLYPTLVQFMVTTGEYFLKFQKYSIIFLTKSPVDKELAYNKNITRLNAYYDRRLIENAIKNENINYLIVNDAISEAEIKWLKSLGVKLIGVSDNIFTSNTVKTTKNLRNAVLYDAFVQDSIDDFNTFKKLNINKNMFIPNIYDTTKTKLSSLNNHNIMLLGKLKDDYTGVISSINAMASIVKQVPDAKLNIISPDSQTLQINQLIKKLDLNKNIVFVPFDTKISYYCTQSSIFIYSSLIPDSPNALNEAMDHGLPCIISNDIANTLFSEEGIIKVDMTKEKDLASEVTKLLKDSKYKNKIGIAAKVSLEKINDEAVSFWDKLFISLKSGEKDFQKLRADNEIKYTLKESKKSSNKAPETTVATTLPTQGKNIVNKQTNAPVVVDNKKELTSNKNIPVVTLKKKKRSSSKKKKSRNKIRN